MMTPGPDPKPREGGGWPEHRHPIPGATGPGSEHALRGEDRGTHSRDPGRAGTEAPRAEGFVRGAVARRTMAKTFTSSAPCLRPGVLCGPTVQAPRPGAG